MKGAREKKASAVQKTDLKRGSSRKFSPAWVVNHAKDAPGFKLELIDRIRYGVKKKEWKKLISDLEATESMFADILPSSISSMQKKEVYDKETSERIYELARLFGLGYEVFDTKSDFNKWLQSPSPALGNKLPFDLLDSSLGFDMVEAEIQRIRYNVYS